MKNKLVKIGIGVFVFMGVLMAAAGASHYKPATPTPTNAETTAPSTQQQAQPQDGNCHAERLRLLDQAMLASDQGDRIKADELVVQSDNIPCPGTNPN